MTGSGRLCLKLVQKTHGTVLFNTSTSQNRPFSLSSTSKLSKSIDRLLSGPFTIILSDRPFWTQIFYSESQPEYFLLSSFVWYSNWPSRYHKLPSRCATATFTISSKTASQIDSHFHTMTWRDLHNSEEGINQSRLCVR